ncbi:uncharacterized protein LOC119090712 [Pollicipes pollicipes]|uniref:uncharacterized protein LOC119090712 n=1 Tax=Pollicipes pollicipes TaxID=41117 RepID=UPI0018851BA8|nr:uncharacterized protein LOC119090712 [Pollicipes pollicipes]
MAVNFKKCSVQLVLHLIIGIALVLVHIFQSCVLNYYIISPKKDSLIAYFWFAADFVILFLFIGSLAIAHRYLRFKHRDRQGEFPYSPKRLIRRYPRSKLGILPLSYASWVVYSTVVVAKVVVIFTSEIPNTLQPTDRWGPQLLKIAIASSGAVFMLLVEGHHDAEPNSARNTYIRLLCGSTAYEIMDSVQFLSLLILSDSGMILPFTLENTVLVLAAVNFLLPTLTLYKLSLSDFGLETGSPYIVLTYKLLHLALVNVAYMVIRIKLWVSLGGDISLFLMKNILGVFTALYSLYPDLLRLCAACRRAPPQKAEPDELELDDVHSAPLNRGEHATPAPL